MQNFTPSKHQVFYLPMHVVYKESTTTKVRDASAKSSTGVSLNDTLLVGPTMHSPLIDVILRFRLHRYKQDVSSHRAYKGRQRFPPVCMEIFTKRYALSNDTSYLRCIGVLICWSSFAANMSVRVDHAHEYP